MKSKEFYRKVNEYIKEIKKEEIVDLVNNILRKIPESKFEEILCMINMGNTYLSDVEIKNRLNEHISKSKLSYGELQMIAFLRAILHKTNIYIFDEPTSNIDLKTEDRIQKLIDKITKESTVIIIAHRKSTIENSDKIIYLKGGRVDMIKNVYN